MIKHYICKGGCKGVSQTPGVCMDENCANHNHELVECNCEDGKHYGAFEELDINENDSLEGFSGCEGCSGCGGH